MNRKEVPKREFYSGPVTALQIVNDPKSPHSPLLYSAMGKQLHICSLDLGKEISTTFETDKVVMRIKPNGFILAGDQIISNQRCIFKVPKLVNERILDALCHQQALYVITTHGFLFKSALDSDDDPLWAPPVQASLLYSATLFIIEDVIYAALGTISSGIQIYVIITQDERNLEDDRHISLILKCTLHGHKGSIFGIEVCPFNSNLIASISDDRTVRVWDIVNERLIFSGMGHLARIWQVAWISEYTLATASEDGDLRVWCFSPLILSEREKNKETSIRTLSGHFGKHVWSVCYGPQFHEIISGGHDGSIRRWPLNSKSLHDVEYSVQGRDIKSFFLTKDSKVAIALDDGHFMVKDFCNQQYEESPDWKNGTQDNCIKNYSLISQFHGQFVVGTLTGCFSICGPQCGSGCSIPLIELPVKVCRIFTSNDHMLTCYADNRVVLDQGCRLISTFSEVTSFLWVNDKTIFVGCRDGTLGLFSNIQNGGSEQIVIISKFGSNAITGIIPFTSSSEEFLIIDRSGLVRLWSHSESSTLYTVCLSSIGSWEGLAWYRERPLAYGFQDTNFVIYDLFLGYLMSSTPCGGSHRPWQLQIMHQNDDGLYFGYLRLKKLHLTNLYIHSVDQFIQTPFHGREIRCGLVLSLNDDDQSGKNCLNNNWVLTGDEGGDMLISVASVSNSKLQPILRYPQAHSNGIKSICNLSEKHHLLCTVGSDSTLKIWKYVIREEFLFLDCKAFWTHEQDIRLMDICLLDENDCSLSFALAASDGFIYLATCSVEHPYDIEVQRSNDTSGQNLSCIMCLSKYDGIMEVVYGGDAQGNLCTYDPHSNSILRRKHYHSGAIFDIIIAENQIITCGDDCHVRFHNLSKFNEFEASKQFHGSAVTALTFNQNQQKLYSIGLDRRIVAWVPCHRQVPTFSIETNVDDASQLLFLDDDGRHLLILGQGLEIICLSDAN